VRSVASQRLRAAGLERGEVADGNDYITVRKQLSSSRHAMSCSDVSGTVHDPTLRLFHRNFVTKGRNNVISRADPRILIERKLIP